MGQSAKTALEIEIERLKPLELQGDKIARGQRNVLVAMLWNM